MHFERDLQRRYRLKQARAIQPFLVIAVTYASNTLKHMLLRFSVVIDTADKREEYTC